MSLRFLSDQCVPAEITDILRRHGHQVILLREVLPIRSPDPVVIAKAQELGAILVSLNGDFADIVAQPARPATIRLVFSANSFFRFAIVPFIPRLPPFQKLVRTGRSW